MIRNIFIAIAVCAMLAESSTLAGKRSRRSADACGVLKNSLQLIIQGQDFPRGSFPWIVALMHTGWTPPKFFCAGTLISRTFVISAAHCILEKGAKKELLPRNILALFGAHDLKDYFEVERIALSPKEIHIHDAWNHLTGSFDADVSLLEFWENKIHFGEYIQPICLWNFEQDPTATEGIVSGWGKSEDPTRLHENIPKLVNALIQSNEDCFIEAKALLDLSSKRTFCAGLRNGSGVCQGDSGGGLFIKVNGVFLLRGIVSSSLIKDDGCDVSKNAVYTNVLKFKDWIRDILSSTTSTVSTTTLGPNLSTTSTVSTKSQENINSNLAALKKVFCIFEITSSYSSERPLNACKMIRYLTIDSEDFVLGSSRNTSIERFHVSFNINVKFLPRLVGEKLPNLKEFYAYDCALTIVRDFHFKNMGSLEYLRLDGNQITTIEPKAFDDLVSLQVLHLDDNRIETLDEKLFVKLVNLRELYLSNNKIKSLSPTTFNIPGSVKLEHVDLRGNVCINGWKGDFGLKLESDVRANCTQ